ncbi:MAG: HupE/UreJ family protein [Desulfobaccales bacterium]
MRLRRGLTLSLTLAVTLAAAPPAHAHLMNTGFGPFYDGLTHLFLTPEDLLPVVALALLAGLRGPRCGRIVLILLPTAWLAASLAGLLVAPQVNLPVVTAAVTIALGVLVAADLPLPLGLVAGGAIVFGFLSGRLNGLELAKANNSTMVALGIVCSLCVVMSLLAGQVASVRAPWARVAVRVAGSWIAAAGLFMLGWAVRGA